MDANEIIKQAPDLLKGGAAIAGALKFTDIIKAILGPATAEIADRFRDEVRRYRYGRQLDCLRKAEEMAKRAGFTPKAVPIKLLFPLLEGASLEESEDLHTMWAALLANSSKAPEQPIVRIGFLDVLKHISKDSALLLNAIWKEVKQGLDFERSMGALPNPTNLLFVGEFTDVLRMYVALGVTTIGDEKKMATLAKVELGKVVLGDLKQFWTCVDELMREDILVYRIETERLDRMKGKERVDVENYYLTVFGIEFLRLCSPPGEIQL
ncbi:Abi-alpha family protein [Paludibaculum fermentans]|uniref:DUF4393 domain-containing protein n=1 Tax=Paludibaculum fermentans TaxID=1473598 RepID=A0A7S7NT05_PALFE|nr:Abi-alpha family protein [Paludibaculum fermentans]QOY88679.1 DUF4393 domain-containing protein [Paludibaculum fermentans]